jgi:hypothetical protein
MNWNTVFTLSSLPVMPLWLLMIVLPTWGLTRRIMRSPLTILAPSLLYVLLVAPQFIELLSAVSNPSLDGIMALLATPAGATIAWVHFLAFDLFAGRWVYLDSRKRGLSPWLVSPILCFVLMLGPLGFLLYLGVLAAVQPGRNTQPSVATADQI